MFWGCLYIEIFLTLPYWFALPIAVWGIISHAVYFSSGLLVFKVM
jgi:hypothetical protein